MSGYRILITGASGFLGSRFLEKISGSQVHDITFTSNLNNFANSVSIDLSDESQVKALLNKIRPTHIFHFAALGSLSINETHKFSSYQKNFVSTNNLIHNCDKTTKFIFTSTDKVYQPSQENPLEDEIIEVPNSFYSLMKLACEDIIAKSLSAHFIFRCPPIHSHGDPSSSSFIDKAILDLKNNKQVVTYTNIIRRFLPVNELVSFFISLLDSDKFGIYNIGSQPVSYYDRIVDLASSQNISSDLILPEIGSIKPKVQIPDLTKFQNSFNMKFS